MESGTSKRGRRGRAAGPPPATPQVPELILAATPSASARRAVTGLLLRFISCGVLALAVGLLWRLTLAPAAIGPAAAFAGVFSLLVGFIAGGIAWYLHDVSRRRANPGTVSDERLVFSFVVFAVVPFAVLLLVGVVWLIAFTIGAA